MSVIVFFCRCLCGECKVMPTARENLCCRKPGSYVLSKMAPTLRCITEAGVIRNSCFVEDVLRGEAVIYEITFPLPDQVETKTWRFLAYRRFVQLIYNETRHRQRHVLPACFVSTVRRLWPSEDGTYVGFQDWCIPSWLGHDLLIAHTKYGSAHWSFMYFICARSPIVSLNLIWMINRVPVSGRITPNWCKWVIFYACFLRLWCRSTPMNGLEVQVQLHSGHVFATCLSELLLFFGTLE